MLRKNELEHYEETDAQDILRLFEAVRSLEEHRVPTDFRLNILRKLSEKRDRPGPLYWFSAWAPSQWVAVLATVLLAVSLGGNALFVTKNLLGQTLSKRRPIHVARNQAQVVQPVPASAYTFQSGITPAADLGILATVSPAIEEQVFAFGFTSQSVAAKSYLIGVLYAEALAYLRSDNTKAAFERWVTIRSAVEPLSAPLAFYTRQVQQWLTESEERTAVEKSELGVAMSLFEPLYETYVGDVVDQALPLFRVGTWLTNMKLAAAAGDKAALLTPQAVEYFQQEMSRLEASKGMMDALAQMHRLTGQESLSDRDVSGLLQLVKQMHRLLG